MKLSFWQIFKVNFLKNYLTDSAQIWRDDLGPQRQYIGVIKIFEI